MLMGFCIDHQIYVSQPKMTVINIHISYRSLILCSCFLSYFIFFPIFHFILDFQDFSKLFINTCWLWFQDQSWIHDLYLLFLSLPKPGYSTFSKVDNSNIWNYLFATLQDPIRSAIIDSCIRVSDNGRESIQRRVCSFDQISVCGSNYCGCVC